MGQRDFISKASDKDLTMIITGVCDGIERDLGSVDSPTTISGKRKGVQLSIFKAVAREYTSFGPKSSRQFVTSTVCELLLARHKDRGTQQVVASHLRVVLSHKPHLEHLLWNHYRRSVASICRELSALCLCGNETGVENLIQDMLICLDLFSRQKFVGMAEIRHNLWNCVDSLLDKYQEVSDIHILILGISQSLFEVVIGHDFEICHEIVPSIIAIGTKLVLAKSKQVREVALGFLLKMDVYLVSVFDKKCPIPLDQSRQSAMEEDIQQLLQVLKQDYNGSSLQDNDVEFESNIVLVNAKKNLQFLTCKTIALLQYVLELRQEVNVKQESDLLDWSGEY